MRFDPYVYGRETPVQTDHKPQEHFQEFFVVSSEEAPYNDVTVTEV